MNKRVVILLIGNSVEMYSILYPAFTFGIERTAADKSTSHVHFMVMVVIFSPEQDPYHRYDSSAVNSCVPRDVDNHDNSKLSLANTAPIQNFLEKPHSAYLLQASCAGSPDNAFLSISNKT